jgi:hypothetical protein
MAAALMTQWLFNFVSDCRQKISSFPQLTVCPGDCKNHTTHARGYHVWNVPAIRVLLYRYGDLCHLLRTRDQERAPRVHIPALRG